MENEKNLLLLSLSTFPFNNTIKEDKFKYVTDDGEEKIVSGKYQLDPVPNMLKEMGLKLDYVILFATTAVKLKKMIHDDTKKVDYEVSPVEYFTDFLKDKLSDDAVAENAITIIDIDENEPATAIEKASKQINEIGKNNKLHIYIDTHGGFRSTQMVIEAILGLLVSDNIKKTVYSVYNDNRNDEKNNTVSTEQKEIFRRVLKDKAEKIFDFVSGINEFKNYGRIESLLRYLDVDNNTELVKSICSISEGIQWCNIVRFEEGLEELKEFYNNEGSKNIEDDYLQLFIDQIRDDYGVLLTQNQIDAIEMVKWCLRKGFYQQALTIIESRAADALINRGIMSLTTAGTTFKNTYEVRSGAGSLSYTEIFNGCIFKFKGQPNWLNCTDNTKPTFESIFSDDTLNDAGIEGKMKECFNNNKISEYVNSANNCSIKAVRNLSTNVRQDITQNGVVAYNGNSEKLVLLLLLHKVIKDMRNKANHASNDGGYSQKASKRAIEFYVYLVEVLS